MISFDVKNQVTIHIWLDYINRKPLAACFSKYQETKMGKPLKPESKSSCSIFDSLSKNSIEEMNKF